MGDTTVDVVKINEDNALDSLPAGVYTLNYNEFRGFYLSITKDTLEIPAKIYGNTPKRVHKCIETYRDRDISTGILMTGDKGTGKTLLMSLLANTVITELNIPVVLIKDAYCGTAFTSFLDLIGECCLVFDEFGKIYTNNKHNDGVSQDELLSLMDGVDKTKRMFILTENSELDISEFMINRPSRIYYHFKYHKLDEDSINGYCVDRNVEDSIVQDIIDLSRRSRIFSFDMLQSIVEEYLRFKTPIDDVVDDLNIDIKEEQEQQMEIIKVVDKHTKEAIEVDPRTTIVRKPVKYNGVHINIKVKDNDDDEDIDAAIGTDDDDTDFSSCYVNESDLSYEENGQNVYEKEKYIIITKDLTTVYTDYKDLL